MEDERAIRVSTDPSGKVLNFNELLDLCLKEERVNDAFSPLKPRAIQETTVNNSPATRTDSSEAQSATPQANQNDCNSHSKYTVGEESLMNSSFLSSSDSLSINVDSATQPASILNRHQMAAENDGKEIISSTSSDESDLGDELLQDEFSKERSRFRRQSVGWRTANQSELDAFQQLENTMLVNAVANTLAEPHSTKSGTHSVEYSVDYSFHNDYSETKAIDSNTIMKSEIDYNYDDLTMMTAATGAFDYSRLLAESSVLANDSDQKEATKSSAATTEKRGASELMQRLFPGLCSPSKQSSKQPPKAPPTKKELMKELREKQEELDGEINECRQLKEQLRKMKHEHDAAFRRLQLDRERLERQREEEEQKLKAAHEEEMKKLRKERRLMEQHWRTTQAMPTRKERQEIEELRERLATSEEAHRLKEAKWQLNQDRLRRRIDDLSAVNGELREEIRLLEQERLARLMDHDKRDKRLTDSVSEKSKSPLIPRQIPTGKETEGSGSKMSAVVENISGTCHRSVGNSKKLSAPLKSSITAPAINRQPAASKTVAAAAATISAISATKQSRRPQDENSQPPPTLSNVSQPRLAGKSLQQTIKSTKMVESTVTANTQTRQEDGTIITRYPNGNVKETSSNGHVVIRLYNGDVKHVFPDKSWVYYFAETMITQTTQADGVVIYDFPDGQVEKRFTDGSAEILYPDQTVRYIFVSGEEETVFADGTISRTDCSGRRIVEYADGSREVYWDDMKQRFEVDGTVKTVFPDGTRETRYADGKIRVLDQQGRLISI